MLEKTLGIVLHIIPYNDKIAVAHLYTERYGRASYLFPQGTGKKARMFRSLFMPFSILELDIDHRNSRELQKIVEAHTVMPLQNIYADPVKNAEALFLSEVLFRAVKDTEPDERLFRFIYDSIQVLEYTDKGIANYHLVFLFHLLRYLGIFPNVTHRQEEVYFDLQNGVFTSVPPLHTHYLGIEETKIFNRLLKITYENMSLYTFSRQERVQIIQRILEYYHLHLPDFSEIKSLSVLRSLFDI